MSKFTIKGGIDFDNKKFKKGLSNAGRDADKFGKKMKGLGKMMAGAFAIGGLTRGIKKIIDLGEDVGNQAAKVGISTDAFQALSHEIITAGGSSEALTTAMNTLKIRQSEAMNGTQTAQVAFQRLGISMEEVANDSLETLLEKISKGKAETRDFDSVADLLGSRTLKDLNTTMNLMADEGLAKIISQAKEAGRVLDEDFIKSATEANRAISDLLVQTSILLSKPIGNIARTFAAINKWFAGGSFLESIGESDPDIQGLSDKAKRKIAKMRGGEPSGVEGATGKEGAAAAAAAVTEVLKVNALRRIGGGIYGGKDNAERLQEAIAKRNAEQVDLLKEISSNTADRQNGTF